MLILIRATMVAALCTVAAAPAAATQWTVVPEASRISFSGSHAGRAFTGWFEKWSADITFDPADLAGSKAVVRVDLASTSTGDATFDKTLPTSDWLDTARSATATFETTAFRTTGAGAYEADGSLEMRDMKLPVTLAFAVKIEGDTAHMSGRARVKRLDFGIGKGADAGGTWVSLEIPLEITVVARRKD